MIRSKTELEDFIVKNWNKINEYLDKRSQELPTPLYSSVDLRESALKYAPVDHNIYPAGFNNVCLLDQLMAGERIKKYLEKKDISPPAHIAIIPESNTRNGFYLNHLLALKEITEKQGYTVQFATFDKSLFKDQTPLKLISQSENEIIFHFLEENENGELFILKNGEKVLFDSCILNHDQSAPFNKDWEKISTPIFPPPQIGWFKRQKNRHFTLYNDVLDDFCSHFKIDKKLMQADFEVAENIDFATKEGLENLHEKASKLFSRLEKGKKVFIKASQGTYGMGISVISSPDEILSFNRKARNKMDIGKNKIKFTSILLQEAVETIVKVNDSPAEVSIYLIEGKSTGGFIRTNPTKGTEANLNSRGMIYEKFCISEICENTDYQVKEAVYSIIARLSTLASAYEIKEVLP